MSLAVCLVAVIAALAGAAALEQSHRRVRAAARHLRPVPSRPTSPRAAALTAASDRLGGSVDARLRR